jgi:perosamine synthetase
MPPRETLLPALEETLYSGYVGQGPKVAEFEQAVGAFLGTGSVTAVNSGTSAIQLALRLAGVRGGTVISTPMTCTATNMPILAEGARPVWADIDPLTGNIDPASVERKVQPDTRAIMAVHWGGTPCDMDALNAIGEFHGIPVIEDAAHALGAGWDGRKIGNGTADFSCFSLQAIKHITTIDGGILACRNRADYERGKLLRWYGIDREQGSRIEADVADWGYKFHMNDVAATIGLAQIPSLPSVLRTHRATAAAYDSALSGRLGTARKPSKGIPAWWLYTVLLRNVAQRDRFQRHMKAAGVATSQVHRRNDTHPCFAASRARLPGVDEFTARMCCVPVHSGLTAQDRRHVARALRDFA